jgi:hypothetical protein
MDEDHWINVLVFNFVISCMGTETMASNFLSTPASNTTVFVGNSVTLLCQTSSTNSLQWYQVCGAQCSSNINIYSGYGSSTIPRFSFVKPSSGQVNLIINPVQLGDANTYVCSENPSAGVFYEASAQLVVIGSIQCTSSMNSACIGSQQDLICSATWNGDAALEPKLVFQPAYGSSSKTSSTGSSVTYTDYVNVTAANNQTIFTCSASFSQSNKATCPPLVTRADSTCATWSPVNVTVNVTSAAQTTPAQVTSTIGTTVPVTPTVQTSTSQQTLTTLVSQTVSPTATLTVPQAGTQTITAQISQTTLPKTQVTSTPVGTDSSK